MAEIILQIFVVLVYVGLPLSYVYWYNFTDNGKSLKLYNKIMRDIKYETRLMLKEKIIRERERLIRDERN